MKGNFQPMISWTILQIDIFAMNGSSQLLSIHEIFWPFHKKV